MQERFCDFLQIPGLNLSVHFGKNLVLHDLVIMSLSTFSTKLARLSLSIFMAKSMLFDLSVMIFLRFYSPSDLEGSFHQDLSLCD